MTPEEEAKIMQKLCADQIKLAKAQNKFNRMIAQDENSRINRTRTLERTYKPFIDTMKPIEETVNNVNQNIIAVNNKTTANLKAIRDAKKSIDTLKNDFNEYEDVSDFKFKQLAILQGDEPNQSFGYIKPEKTSFEQEYESLGDLARYYMSSLDKGSLNIRWNKEKQCHSLGQSKIKFDNNDLTFYHVDGESSQVTGTKGLWYLLTQNERPIDGWNSISAEDKEIYCQLLDKTGECYRDDGKRKSSKSEKYIKIVKPYLDEKTGAGFSIRFLSPDIEELLQRLYIILGNMENKHTNINENHIYEASQILDILYKKKQISKTTHDNLYELLKENILKYSKR